MNDEPTIAIPKSLYDELVRKAKAYDTSQSKHAQAGAVGGKNLVPTLPPRSVPLAPKKPYRRGWRSTARRRERTTSRG